jgi:hypothetical protein
MVTMPQTGIQGKHDVRATRRRSRGARTLAAVDDRVLADDAALLAELAVRRLDRAD